MEFLADNGIEAGRFEVINKPWGKEHWLRPSKEHGKYLIKLIEINKGYRSSVHGHEERMETMYIIDGRLLVWSGEREKVLGVVDGREVLVGNLTPKEFRTGDFFHVYPRQVHRVEGLTNVLLIEMMSYHPDDVKRYADDWNRGHGRIAGEHQI